MKMYLRLIQLMKCFWCKLSFPNTKCPEMTHLACNILDLQCVPFSFGFSSVGVIKCLYLPIITFLNPFTGPSLSLLKSTSSLRKP